MMEERVSAQLSLLLSRYPALAPLRGEIAAAYEFAKNSPWPNPDEVIDNMFTSDNERSVLR